MELNSKIPLWKTFASSQESLRTSLLLELPNNLALLKQEIELSLKLDELWSLKLVFLCDSELKLLIQRVIPKIVPLFLSVMGKLPMSYLMGGNQTSLTFICLGVFVTS